MKNIYVVNLFFITLLFLVGCSEDQNPTFPSQSAPSELIDPIPYDILGSGKIVFERLGPDGGGYDAIYIIDIDHRKSWVINFRSLSSPCISPNGDKITLTHMVDTETAFDVYVMDVFGNNLKQLSHHPSQERFPTWNKKGDLIIYWNYPVIYSVNQYGEYERTVNYDSHRSPSGRLSVSENNKIIYACNNFIINDSTISNRVFSMNIDGGELESLIEAEEDESLESPRFSPDDNFIAYISVSKDENWEFESMRIHLFNINENTDTIIYESVLEGSQYSNPGINSSIWLCWSPDGSKILFTRPIEHLTSYIYVINNDGSQLTQVTSLEGVTDRSISWSK